MFWLLTIGWFRHAEVRADIEQVILNSKQPRVDFLRKIGRPNQPEHRVQLVDCPVCDDTIMSLRDARSISESGLPGVTTLRINLIQKNHSVSLRCMLNSAEVR